VTGRLAGRLCVVTGAASGMGRATALLFAREGATVIAADRDALEGSAAADAAVAAGGSASFQPLDVTLEGDWDALANRVRAERGPLAALVHCAGIGSGAGGGPTGSDGYRALMDVNALGTLLALRTAAALMRGAGGSIVTVGSVTALRTLGSDAMNVGYAASKSAVRSLTRAFAVAEGPHGIRVNCILPGFMPPMRGSAMPSEGGESPYLSQIPLGRTGEVDDVAAAALFLASDDARYISGIDLPVDGGYLA
jgi:3alpha(or 20beta)-hydroxysteroid dehydrogenase